MHLLFCAHLIFYHICGSVELGHNYVYTIFYIWVSVELGHYYYGSVELGHNYVYTTFNICGSVELGHYQATSIPHFIFAGVLNLDIIRLRLYHILYLWEC